MTAPSEGQASTNVIAFQPRSAAGDWTAAELQRLEELARKLESQGAHVEAGYGVSDAGDPWCVITDDADDVLIHVARIDGRFVVHDAAADALQDGDTLWSACDRLLGQTWRDGREDGVVIPLHQAQVLLALVAALVFEQEGRTEQPGAAPALPTAHPHSAPIAATLTTAMVAVVTGDLLHLTPRGAALAGVHDEADSHRTASLAPSEPIAAAPALPAFAHALAAPSPSVAPTAAIAPALLAAGAPSAGSVGRVEIAGRVLTGGHGGDVLIGGPGADTLAGGGAGPGQTDVLLGGSGADRLLLAAHTVAIGGPGHDVFAFSRPTTPEPHPQPPPAPTAQPATVEPPLTAPTSAPTPTSLPTSLPPTHPQPEPPAGQTTQGGVIVDFTTDDRLDFGPGPPVTVVSVEAVSDVLAGLHGNPALSTFAATPGQAVGFDFNGDGVADLTVLVAGPAVASFAVGATIGAVSTATPEPTPGHAEAFLASIHAAVPGAFLLG